MVEVIDETIGLLKSVYYFNGHLFYKIEKEEIKDFTSKNVTTGKYRNKLLKNNGEYKDFLICDTVDNVLYYRDEFIFKFFGEEVPDIKDLFTELMKMRFKIFRKIRLKM